MPFKRKPIVLVATSRCPKPAIDLLQRKCRIILCNSYILTEEEILNKIMGVNAILWTSRSGILTEKIIEKAGSDLKVVAVSSVDISNLNVEELKARKIKIGISSEVHADSVASHAVGLMIYAGRRMFEYELMIKSGVWDYTYGASQILGTDFMGAVVGFVGFGVVGQAIAKRLIGFDIGKIIYYCRTKKIIPSLNKQITFVNFYELLTQSDIIFCCCPCNYQTENLFNDVAFNNMKSHCIFVNVSHGSIVDENALYKALLEKKIFAAGLDGFTRKSLEQRSQLLDLPNCVITPRIGNSTNRTRIDTFLVAAHNILRGLCDEPLYDEY